MFTSRMYTCKVYSKPFRSHRETQNHSKSQRKSGYNKNKRIERLDSSSALDHVWPAMLANSILSRFRGKSAFERIRARSSRHDCCLRRGLQAAPLLSVSWKWSDPSACPVASQTTLLNLVPLCHHVSPRGGEGILSPHCRSSCFPSKTQFLIKISRSVLNTMCAAVVVAPVSDQLQ